jgi:GNAT superfamily N-acetyltransferase
MAGGYEIVYEPKPEEAAWGIIGRGVGSFNQEQVGETGFARICFVLRDPEGEVAGGVLGEVHYGWLHVDLLWVREDLRGQGYGRGLLAEVEQEAKKQGAQRAFLDTFDFQAPEFYRKQGYEVLGELADFPPGHRRLYLAKGL